MGKCIRHFILSVSEDKDFILFVAQKKDKSNSPTKAKSNNLSTSNGIEISRLHLIICFNA